MQAWGETSGGSLVDATNWSEKVVGRRLALRLIGLGAGVGLLAACAPGAPQAPAAAPTSAAPPAQPAATTAPAAAAPTAATNANVKPGGTLRTGLLADISSLDGHLLRGPDNNTT